MLSIADQLYRKRAIIVFLDHSLFFFNRHDGLEFFSKIRIKQSDALKIKTGDYSSCYVIFVNPIVKKRPSVNKTDAGEMHSKKIALLNNAFFTISMRDDYVRFN